MFCEFLIINLTLRTLTCLGSQLFYTVSVGVPKAGYEVSTGYYAIEGFYIDAITTYKGKRVNVGRFVVCLDNGSCIHEYPANPDTVGTISTHGCFRVKTMKDLFWHIMPGTIVEVTK